MSSVDRYELPIAEERLTDEPGKRTACCSWRNWGSRWMLLMIATGFSLVCAEGVLRLLPRSFVNYPRYVTDDITGSKLMPSIEGWQTKEGQAWVATNSLGFRDREHSLAKPPRTFRIAILGDSYAEAVQVDQSEAFWSLLETELASCVGDRYDTVECLNFGVSGFGTAQELLLLRNEVWQFSPDLIVLAFLPANDVQNNSRELESDRLRPFFRLENNTLHLDDSFKSDPQWLAFRNSRWIHFKEWVTRHSELAALLSKVRQRIGTSTETAAAVVGESGLNNEIYAPPESTVWTVAWEITERLLGEMTQECRLQKVPLIVMSVTSGTTVHPDLNVRKAACDTLKVDDLLYPDRWLEGVGDRYGFAVLLLTKTMQDEATKTGAFFHGFSNTQLGTGHWNQAGHAFAAKMLSELICSERLVSGG